MALSGGKTMTAVKKSKNILGIFCQPCDHYGSRCTASGYCATCQHHLCKSCFNHHKKHTMSKYHILLDRDSMPMTLQTPEDNLTFLCSKHKEDLKFYCSDHKELVCPSCVYLKHKVGSCKVSFIPCTSKQIQHSLAYKNILTSMENLSDNWRHLSKKVETSKITLEESFRKALATIYGHKVQIMCKINELVGQAVNDAKALHEQRKDQLKLAESTCIEVTASLDNSVKHLMKSDNPDRLFTEVCEQVIKDYEKKILEFTNTGSAEVFKFLPNSAIKALLETENSLGAMEILHFSSKEDLKARKAEQVGKIDIKVPESLNQCCWVPGMTLLNPECLIVSDWNNKAIKVVDTHSQTVTDQLHPCMASDVVKISNYEFAVSLKDEGMVHFISFTSGELEIVHSIQLERDCFGLGYHDGKLVVTFANPGRVQILDMTGDIKTVEDFYRPYYVATNDNGIYISDQAMGTVTMMDWQGQVMGSYKDLKNPSGIALSNDGSLFVCEQDGHEILELAGDLSAGQVLLKDIDAPNATCWCEEESKLYYSLYTCSKDSDRFIEVVKIS